MVTLDLWRRGAGYGFVIFAALSIAGIAGAALTQHWALTTQDGVVFGINPPGICCYLIRKRADG